MLLIANAIIAFTHINSIFDVTLSQMRLYDCKKNLCHYNIATHFCEWRPQYSPYSISQFLLLYLTPLLKY